MQAAVARTLLQAHPQRNHSHNTKSQAISIGSHTLSFGLLSLNDPKACRGLSDTPVAFAWLALGLACPAVLVFSVAVALAGQASAPLFSSSAL